MEIAPVKNRGLQNTSIIRDRWVISIYDPNISFTYLFYVCVRVPLRSVMGLLDFLRNSNLSF